MKQKKHSPKRKTGRPGCIFWIALILLVFFIFLLNHKTIEEALAAAGFFNFFSRDKSNIISVERITAPDSPASASDIPEEKTEIEIVSVPEIQREEDRLGDMPEIIDKQDDKDIILSRTRETSLYFIQINDDGTIALKKVTRNIKFTDSPLTSAITSLLSGLNSDEISKNYISLIPDKSALNRIFVESGTAFIDFNDFFLFNSFGREGYIGQLMQIVYTATEFPTVYNVQFLIDGKIRTYLGGEGIFIEKPIGRDSF